MTAAVVVATVCAPGAGAQAPPLPPPPPAAPPAPSLPDYGGTSCFTQFDYGSATRLPCEARPVVDVDVTPLAPRTGTPVTLRALKRGGDDLTYTWDLDGDEIFDDGAGQQISHVFTVAAATRVTVQAADGGGRTARAWLELAVHSQNRAPRATLSSSSSSLRVGRQGSFSLQATDVDGTIAQATVDTDGDGDVDVTLTGDAASLYRTIAFTPSAPGSYTAIARFTDNDGAPRVARMAYVVYAHNRAPSATLIAPERVTVGQEFTVTASSYDGDGLVRMLELDLDGDGEYEVRRGLTNGCGFCGAVSSVKLTLDQLGRRVIRLRATDDEGATETSERVVEAKVGNDKPDITGLSVTPGASTVSASVSATDIDGALDEVAFDLDGNGTYEVIVDTPSSVTTRTFPLPAPGSHELGVKVTDDDGAQTVRRTTYLVDVRPLLRQINAPAFAAAGSQATIYASIAGESGGATYAWDLNGDDIFTDSASSTPVVDVPDTGGLNIALRFTPRSGVTQVARARITSVPTTMLDVPTFSIFAPARLRVGNPGFVSTSAYQLVDGVFHFYNDASYRFDTDADGEYDDVSVGSGYAYTYVSFDIAGPHVVGVEITLPSGHVSHEHVAIDVDNAGAPPEVHLTRRIDEHTSTPLADRLTLDDGEIAVLQSTPTDEDHDATSVAWDVDGTGFAVTGPTVAVLKPPRDEPYPVRVRVTDATGLQAVQTVFVTVRTAGAFNHAPAPSISTTSGAAQIRAGGLLGLFGYAADADDDDVTIAWDLDGDGLYDDATGQQASVNAPPSAGTLTVAMRARDDRGAESVARRTFTVVEGNPPPTVSLSVCCTSGFAFVSASDDRSVARLELDLDGQPGYERTSANTGASLSRTLTYAVPPADGELTLRARVTDDEGATATTEQTVLGPPPDRGVGMSVNVSDDGRTARLFAYDPAGFFCGAPGCTSPQFAWDLDGNGTYTDASGSFASVTASTRGPVTVRVRSTLGAATLETSRTFVLGPLPSARFAWTRAPEGDGQRLTFTSEAQATDGATITARTWDLDGDGAFDDGSGETVQHSYPAPGSVSVAQRVVESTGEVNIGRASVDIESPTYPTAGIRAVPYDVRAGDPARLESRATDPQGAGDIASILWNLDDDDAYDDASGASVPFSSVVTGTHVVAVQVTDHEGHVTTSRSSVYVYAATVPYADPYTIDASPYSPLVDDPVELRATPDYGGDQAGRTVSWDLNADGTYGDAAGATITRQFNTPGVVAVAVKVYDGNAVVGGGSLELVVRDTAPRASFTTAPDVAKVGAPVTFTSTSTAPAPRTIATTTWDLDGDGDYDDAFGVTATHSYDTAGLVDIGVRVVDDLGRARTRRGDLQIREVNNAPRILTLDATSTAPRYGRTVTFTAHGADIEDGGDLLYDWRVGTAGDYDAATGTAFSRSFSPGDADAQGRITIGVKVTDRGSDGLGANARSVTRALVLTPVAGNRPPVIHVHPSRTEARRPADHSGVRFDLAASVGDPDDSGGPSDIANIAWDVDGNGSYGDPADLSGPDLRAIAPVLDAGAPDTGTIAHTITARVTDTDGATATFSVTLTTSGNNHAPSVTVVHRPFDVTRGQDTTFVADVYDPDGDTLTYTWDLDGNGGYGDATTRTAHTVFDVRGARTVGVKVSDGTTTVDAFDTFTVGGQRPVVRIARSTYAPAPHEQVTLTSASTDPDGTVATLDWDLDDDGAFDDASGPTAHVTLDVIGTRTIGLRAVDNDGDAAALQELLTAHEPLDDPQGNVGTPDPSVTTQAGGAVPASIRVDEQSGLVEVRLGRGQLQGGCLALDLDVPIRSAFASAAVLLVVPDGETVPNRIAMARLEQGGVYAGRWTAHVPCLSDARLLVEYRLPDPDHPGSTVVIGPVAVGGITLVDPQGVVYDNARYAKRLSDLGVNDPAAATEAQRAVARTAAAVSGASVQLQRYDAAVRRFRTVPADDPGISPNVNPLPTGDDGLYRWDVSEGIYRVVVRKPGYDTTKSDEVAIPPPKTDLHIGIEPNPAPEALFTPPLLRAGQTVTLMSASTLARGVIKSTSWSFDGGAPVQGTSVGHAFATAGDHTIELRVEDGDGRFTQDDGSVDDGVGQISVLRRTVRVLALPPVPSITAPASTTAGTQVPVSVALVGDPAAAASTWTWSGSGASLVDGDKASAKVTFARGGSHTISVSILTLDGQTVTTSATIAVAPRNPVLTIAGPDTATAGQAVTFTATVQDGSGATSAVLWDTNDDGVYGDASGSAVALTFPVTGVGTVRARVTSDDGGSADAARTVTITAAQQQQQQSGQPSQSQPIAQTPATPPATRPVVPTLTFALGKIAATTRAVAARLGISVPVRCSLPCVVTFKLTVSRPVAKKLGSRSVVIVKTSARLPAGGGKTRLRIPVRYRRALLKTSGVVLKLTATTPAPDGSTLKAGATVKLK